MAKNTVQEADLYPPVKAYLETLGFTVRGEVRRCDVVGMREDFAVAVELKLSFGLPVLYQALERLSAVDLVYVAVNVPYGIRARANWEASLPDAERLCRMLGIGMICIRDGVLNVHVEPQEYQPRKNPRARARLVSEFLRRSGDHNVGGTTKRPRITAYREDALRVLQLLKCGESMSAVQIKKQTGVARSYPILNRDVYGWFVKTGRGQWTISDKGHAGLVDYADVLLTQEIAGA